MPVNVTSAPQSSASLWGLCFPDGCPTQELRNTEIETCVFPLKVEFKGSCSPEQENEQAVSCLKTVHVFEDSGRNGQD